MMRAYDLIWKKREGQELSPAEVRFLVEGFVAGRIPDYQISAWAMAVFFRGMSFAECTALTLAMADSGERLDLSPIPGPKLDKHSTGGVGDKTSLVVLPLVAAAGVPVAKMSGRALGHTGGTIDKLEAIPGFRTTLTREQFLAQVIAQQLALVSQSGNLVPADKKLYALRDLTATVESIPLIASSIVSKKLAAGADGVVLDVKFGDGAFVADYQQARQLAVTMVEIGKGAGKDFIAVLSNMAEPLGYAVGNSLEVAEAIQTLRGEGPTDLTQLSLTLSGYMIYLAGKAASFSSGYQLATDLLNKGQGLARFREWVVAQGGEGRVVDDPKYLPQADVIIPVIAQTSGYVEAISCRQLGLIAMGLGAGRIRLEEQIKPEVGLVLRAKVGDYLSQGTIIAEVHGSKPVEVEAAALAVAEAFEITPESVTKPSLVGEVIGV